MFNKLVLSCQLSKVIKQFVWNEKLTTTVSQSLYHIRYLPQLTSHTKLIFISLKEMNRTLRYRYFLKNTEEESVLFFRRLKNSGTSFLSKLSDSRLQGRETDQQESGPEDRYWSHEMSKHRNKNNRRILKFCFHYRRRSVYFFPIFS